MIRSLYPIRTAWIPVLLMPLMLYACRAGPEQVPPRFIPYAGKINIDGNAGDWHDIYPAIRILSDICGHVPDSADLLAKFRLAWNEQGLFILTEVRDDSLYEDPSRFWNGDGVELFISPQKGSLEIIQVSVRPSYDLPDSLTALIHYDHRRSEALRQVPPGSRFCSSISSNGYLLEGIIPLDVLGITEPVDGTEMAVQVYVNDADREGDSLNFSLPWYPVRDSYRNPYAFHRIRFSRSVPRIPSPEVRAYLKDDRTIHVKVLSDRPCPGKELKIRFGNHSRRIQLRPESGAVYSHRCSFPYRKPASSGYPLEFMWRDSTFFLLDLCLLHRTYEEKTRPNRFEEEIRIFEIMDHFQSPPENPVLFTGSSTIRKWYDLENDLPGIDLLNRGFGGSTMKDLNYYRDRIVFPYHPSKIFVYEGDNDIARGASPQEYLRECLEFIRACERVVPEAEIHFISIKPSPARIRNWPEMRQANLMLEELSGRFEKVHYIDVSACLQQAGGKPRKDLFESDRLHLNAPGYDVLVHLLRPFLYE